MEVLKMMPPRGMRSKLIAVGAVAIPCGMVAAFGFKPPPGNTHHWAGNTSDSWHVASNWVTGVVPADEDAAIVLDGPFNNIYLSDDSADLATLYIGSAKSVVSLGHVLRVQTGSASTTVIGTDSSLFMHPVSGGVPGFVGGELSLEDEGRLTMAGGRVRVTDQLTLLDGGRVNGHGWIEVMSPAPASFNGLDGGPMNVSGGDLRIDVNNGGSLVLPPDVMVMQADRMLDINGPMFLPAQNVSLGSGCTIDVSSDWSLDGVLESTVGPGETSTVTGGGLLSVEGSAHVSGGGRLLFDSTVEFNGGSSMTIGSDSTIELAGDHDAQPLHETNIGQRGQLLVTGPQFAFVYSGDILSSAGTIEISNGADHWNFDGTLTLGSLFGLRSHIAGATSLRAYGPVYAPGLGGVVDGELEIMSTSLLELGVPNSRLMINGRVQIHGGADVLGQGQIDVHEGGVLLVGEPTNIEVDVVNSGTFAVGPVIEQIGYSYLDENYTQTSSGRMVVQMGGASPLMRDVCETAGSMSLSGELVVELVDGFEPSVGDSFDILFANGGVSGSFDTVSGDPGFVVEYSATVVTITYEGDVDCAADLSGDGQVGVDDLLELLGAWGVCGECSADIDGNGVVDVTDLLDLLAAWGSCPA